MPNTSNKTYLLIIYNIYRKCYWQKVCRPTKYWEICSRTKSSDLDCSRICIFRGDQH